MRYDQCADWICDLWQASRSLNALRKATHTTSRVQRDGKEQIIDSVELVTGDIVILTVER